LVSTSAFQVVRGRHSLGVANSKDFLSPSTCHNNQGDEFFSHIKPSQSRHSALCHSPIANFARLERDNTKVDSPYKSGMMYKALLPQLLETSNDVGNEGLGVRKFRQPFNEAPKILSSTIAGLKKVSCANINSDALGNSFNP